jgi:hypothetical protein
MTSETHDSHAQHQPPAQIVVIRHAEKPPANPPPSGVQQVPQLLLSGDLPGTIPTGYTSSP